jgi:hypothetical protein
MKKPLSALIGPQRVMSKIEPHFSSHPSLINHAPTTEPSALNAENLHLLQTVHRHLSRFCKQ